MKEKHLPIGSVFPKTDEKLLSETNVLLFGTALALDIPLKSANNR